MKPLPILDMLRATRLTRAGRLTEATSLLRGSLLGSAPPAPDADTGSASALVPDNLRHERVQRALGLRSEPAVTTDGDEAFAHSARMPGSSKGRFVDKIFADASGQHAYKLYVPGGYQGQPLPLIVMLHGCTQSPDDFAAGTQMNVLAEEQCLIVAYPAQSRSANPSKCWNWFNAADQQRGRGEPALIAGITRQIMKEHAVDPKRVYVAGLSAGGAAAAIMGMTYPDLYAAIGVHSGLSCGAAKDMGSAFLAMKGRGAAPSRSKSSSRTVPAIVFHGDRDKTVSPVNGDQVIAQFKGTTPSPRHNMIRGKAPGGLDYTRVHHLDHDDKAELEHWVVHGAAHAWSGGSSSGSYTEPRGPDASREMVRFFLEHPLRGEVVSPG